MKKCLTLNKTYLNLKSFYSTPNNILSTKFNLNTSINHTIHNINQNLTLLNPSSTINNTTTKTNEHKHISPYLKRSLTTTKIRLLNIPKMPYLTQSTTSICTKANTTNLSTNRNTESNRSPPPSKISFNYKLKLTKLNNHNTINTSNSTTNISKLSNYKRFLFPLSASSRTTMKYNHNNNTTTINTNRSLTPDTTVTNNNVFISNNTTLSITHSRNYVNHNNNYHQIKHHSPNSNNNNERKCFKHNQMLKTSYSYIANKQREIDKDNQWRKEFYDNIRKKFFNKLLLRKQKCERYRYDSIDENYFQMAMDNDNEIEHNNNNNNSTNSNNSNSNKHKQIIFSCIPSKTNGLLNIVNKANADLLKYSDSFIKLNSSSFNEHYSYILHQYQTYRKNANIKGTTLQCSSSSSSRKPKPNLSQLTHIHNKYELIKRDYTKLQHLLQKYISPSLIPQA